MYEVASAFAGAPDLYEALDRATAGTNVGLCCLCVSEYCANDIVEIMGNAARERPDGLHAPSVLQVLL